MANGDFDAGWWIYNDGEFTMMMMMLMMMMMMTTITLPIIMMVMCCISQPATNEATLCRWRTRDPTRQEEHRWHCVAATALSGQMPSRHLWECPALLAQRNLGFQVKKINLRTWSFPLYWNPLIGVRFLPVETEIVGRICFRWWLQVILTSRCLQN